MDNNGKCEWVAEGDGFKCKRCGFVPKHNRVKKKCDELRLPPEPPAEIPSLPMRIKNAVVASAKHVAKGLPVCSDEEVEARFKTCSTNECRLFNTQYGVCMHQNCGCNIRNNGKYLDKLRWADSECPIGLWKSIEK